MENKQNENLMKDIHGDRANSEAPKPIKTNALLITIFICVSFAMVFFVQFLLLPAIENANMQALTPSPDYWQSRTVQLKSDDGSSTGFVIESEKEGEDNFAYIVTAYHCVKTNLTSAKVRLGKSFEQATLVGVSQNSDLAFYKIKTSESFSRITVSDADMGSRAWAIGNAFGDGIKMTDGIVARRELADVSTSPELVLTEVTCRIYSGMSGCPVYGENHALIGMGLRQAYENNGGSVHYLDGGYLLPAAIVMNEYNRIKNTTKAEIAYTVQKGEDGAIKITVHDGKTFVSEAGALWLGDEKVNTVCGKTVKNAIDFIEVITDYCNLTPLYDGSEEGVWAEVVTQNSTVQVRVG